MKTQFFIFAFLLSLFAGTSGAQVCYTKKQQNQATPPAGCFNCNTLDSFYNPHPVFDSVVYIKLNWFFIEPTNTNIGYWLYHQNNVGILDVQALINDPSIGLNNIFDSLYYPQNVMSGVAYLKRPKIQFVLNQFSFVTDNSLFFGPDMPDNSTWAQGYAVPPAAYLNPDGAINVLVNADTNTFIGGNGFRQNQCGYGIAGGIPAPYCNLRTCMPISPSNGSWVWWDNCMLLAHELGHCLGLVHTNYHSGCLNDYVVEGSNLWGGPNNIMGYSWTQRRYLSPRQVETMHLTLTNLFADLLAFPRSLPYLTVDHNYDLTVNSNQIWASERYIRGDITVKSGKTLTILCRVGMRMKARIIVEKGAKLLIDGGEVTNFSGRIWRGIELEGNPTQTLAFNTSTGYYPNHGWLEIINQGTISHAEFGVVGCRTNAAGNWVNNTNGGVIRAYNANFINNVFDAFIFNYTVGGMSALFFKCSFVTNGKVGLDFAGTSRQPAEHIKIYKNRGVSVQGCRFENTTGTMYPAGNKGTGIYSTDAYFSVDHACNGQANWWTPCSTYTRSTFKNMTTGIWIDNINPLYNISILHSDFYDLNFWATIAENSNFLLFQYNTVYKNGLYLYACKYYDIRENTFNGQNRVENGIIAFNSGVGAHNIYFNKFSNLGYAINAIDDNGGQGNYFVPGLKMNCNDFSPSSNNIYDIAVNRKFQMPSVYKQQGALGATTPTNLVRNIYGAQWGIGVKNKWFIHSTNNQYILHTCNSTPSTDPNNPFPQASPQLWLAYTNIALNYTEHCNPNPGYTGGLNPTGQRLANMNDYIIQLQASNTDHENDQEIQATVACKMGIFLSDSVEGNSDSLLALLRNNDGMMEDADIQLIYAYMLLGDYTTATDLTNSLPSSRADWMELLLKTIEIEQTADGVYTLIDAPDYVDFLSDYALTEDKDGQASARAMLKFSLGLDFDLPIAYAEDDGQMKTILALKKEEENKLIKMYPNPAHSGITLSSELKDQTLTVEIKDMLGKVVFNGTLGKNANEFISLQQFSAGMYLITISKDNSEIVYQNKLVKED